jgi:NADH-quinone oxidoreductase subunit B
VSDLEKGPEDNPTGSQDPTLDVVRETSSEVVARRQGMFGVLGTGDTSGYGGLVRQVEMPGSTVPPYGGWMDDVVGALTAATRDGGIEAAIEKVVVHRGEITFFVRREHIAAVARLLRDDEDLRFEVCSGVSGVLLTTVEGVAGYMRKASFWPATFGLACCAIEMMTTGGPRYDLARFGMEVFRASPRQADLMIVAGRVSNKMAPVVRQIYDQMAAPKYVLAMGVCASSGGMFNNYAIVQGVDHVVPVDMYLPGCPPRPEMLIDAILKLHEQVQNTKLGVNRALEIEQLETAALRALPTSEMRGQLR